jgi:serine/threonine protein kinase
MKNLYLLPASSSNNLAYLGSNGLRLGTAYTETNYCKPQNIYITSENEEPKLDDWGINKKNNVVFKSRGFSSTEETKKLHRKIILTTDERLIKEGVRQIDATFLEWFVKNSDCTYVEVTIETMFKGYSTYPEEMSTPPFFGNLKHKITIPKVQKEEGFCTNCNNDVCCCKIVRHTSIEEAARLYRKLHEFRVKKDRDQREQGFIDGAKWQQERSFSQEELLEHLNLLQSMSNSTADTFTDSEDRITKKWFNQFNR